MADNEARADNDVAADNDALEDNDAPADEDVPADDYIAADDGDQSRERLRDLTGWLGAPLVTLVLAPLVALSVGIMVGVSTTDYPEICRSAQATNGCEETIASMLVLHGRIFLAGWLLLWALPWWRGLRPYRIGFSILVGAVLVAAPLRLVDTSTLDRIPDWDTIIRAERTTAEQDSTYATVLGLTALAFVLLPIVAAFWLFLIRRRRAATLVLVVLVALAFPSYELARLSFHAGDRAGNLNYLRNQPPHPHQCVVHSGSDDGCPGG